MKKTGVFLLLCSFPIGVFDSGVGGLSVLKRIRELLPYEDTVYYADFENAPYGSKSNELIKEYTERAVDILIRNYRCKLIVIACNTATSVCADHLREMFNVPIVGLEPAIKPAITKYPNGDILVLATPVTLANKKFKALLSEIGNERIECVAAPMLVRFVEAGKENDIDAIEYLRSLFLKFDKIRFSACVLGCTHFPFATDSISKALGYTPEYFDGSIGAAKRVKQLLESNGLKSVRTTPGGLVFYNSSAFLKERWLKNNK